MYSTEALYLMTCTALVESKLTHIKQMPSGPALGFFQVEWATYLDVVRYLEKNRKLFTLILYYCERDHFPMKTPTHMCDMVLNVLIARVKYYMQPEPLPTSLDAHGLANYYKKYYNTYKGDAVIDTFVKAYQDVKGWIENDKAQGVN
jgi:hypothetical protein